MKIFLDSNVFIWAYNRPESNSAKILELMDEEKDNSGSFREGYRGT